MDSPQSDPKRPDMLAAILGFQLIIILLLAVIAVELFVAPKPTDASGDIVTLRGDVQRLQGEVETSNRSLHAICELARATPAHTYTGMDTCP